MCQIQRNYCKQVRAIGITCQEALGRWRSAMDHVLVGCSCSECFVPCNSGQLVHPSLLLFNPILLNLSLVLHSESSGMSLRPTRNRGCSTTGSLMHLLYSYRINSRTRKAPIPHADPFYCVSFLSLYKRHAMLPSL